MNLEIIKLNNTNNKHFAKAWQLYIDSFPIEERRTLIEQQDISNKKNYTALGFIEKENFIGILFYWNFKDYIFLEHFAINPSLRGKSYGSKILTTFLSKNENIVLEIEPIEDEITQKRFDFYKRFDFRINDYKHFQIPLRKGEKELKLLLLSQGKYLSKEEYHHLYELMKINLSF